MKQKTHKTEKFPIAFFLVFISFALFIIPFSFLPGKLRLFPSLRLFILDVFNNDSSQKIEITDNSTLNNNIEKLEKSLNQMQSAGPIDSSSQQVETKKPNPVKTGEPKKFDSEFLQFYCRKGSEDGCKLWTLDNFYNSLRQTGNNKKTTIISYFGDSIISRDKITSQLRENFQNKFGNSGPGYFLMQKLWKWTGHKQVYFYENGWKAFTILNPVLKSDKYGFGGIVSRTIGPGAYTEFKIREDLTSVNRISVFYITHPEGGKLQIKVDGQLVKSTDTRQNKQIIKKLTSEARGKIWRVESGKGGVVQIAGVSLENDKPGVIVDAISLTGGRLIHLTNSNQNHYARAVALRHPQLMILHFGVNEVDTGMREDYAPKAITMLKHLLASNKQMSCLIMGPTDKVTKSGGEYHTLNIIKEIIKVQKSIARRSGCAFFNSWKAMGGEASIVAWHNHRPRLAVSDLTHITDAGGEKMASILYVNLIKGYLEYLKGKRSK
ncbi:MAG: hypothetical protein PF689_00565 [Deltaproteobacteria bacterium]|nr:hypothetical protein [Deltaproteobacteria bacterium]